MSTTPPELGAIARVSRSAGSWSRKGVWSTWPHLGGYKYTAFGKLVTADAGTPAPTADGTLFDQPLRWQGRWFSAQAGGVYDFRNRWWSPELGAFLTPDEFGYFNKRSTLWGWPGQNPLRFHDPSGLVVPLPAPQPGDEFVGLSGAFTFTEVGVFMFSNAYQSASSGNYGEAALDAASGIGSFFAAETNLAFEAWMFAGMPGLGGVLGPKTCPVELGGARVSNIAPTEAARIQNAATRIGRPVSLVGSRAAGTAGPSSDWDYVIQGANSATRRSAGQSLPGSGNLNEGTRPNQDIFRGPLDPDRPSITFYPED